MRSAWLRPSFAAVVIMALSGAAASRGISTEASRVIPVEDLQFYQNKEGLTVANAWGDPANGAHSNFIRMPGGARSGLHTHSFSYYGVVVSGTLSNEASDDAAARSLEPGSYWFQKGGEPHVTNCISQTACLIFVTSKGTFDFHRVASPTRPSAPQARR
ncbi:DUF4437 domain-containing protein [Sphingomonas sp. AR_OL41]|uniref:DUF4437 domain-containing protein n=1 Tax=Sphingomonas sp. AR_OL41 TaxID=3042729 RepID=UPI002480243C|nr:DUF4437 domain-containing protein [Sphingomonas sp. AR_OL41]MDH7972849.1 DUF4437 domain-containing protein [Sphingomonas sp. AR_OL41]